MADGLKDLYQRVNDALSEKDAMIKKSMASIQLNKVARKGATKRPVKARMGDRPDRNADIKKQMSETDDALAQIKPMGSGSFNEDSADDMDMIVASRQDPRLLDTVDDKDLESYKPSAPAKTRETMPKIDGAMRSISSGNDSVFSTMQKAEMGKDKGVGELSSDVTAMKAKAPTLSGDRIQSLFKKATGTSFNPKSKADRAALTEIEALMSARPDLADASDTKVALAWYKSKKK